MRIAVNIGESGLPRNWVTLAAHMSRGFLKVLARMCVPVVSWEHAHARQEATAQAVDREAATRRTRGAWRARGGAPTTDVDSLPVASQGLEPSQSREGDRVVADDREQHLHGQATRRAEGRRREETHSQTFEYPGRHS